MDYFNNSDLLCTPTRSELKLKRPIYQFVSESCPEPVTVSDFKQFASIDYATDDNLILKFLRAARVQCEQYLQRSLVVRQVAFSAEEAPDNYYLSWGPIDAGSINGAYEVRGDYLLKGGRDILMGFTSTDELGKNPQIQEGLLILAMSLYDNRERILSRERETGELVDLWREKLKPYKKMSSI